jgi:hypothetical protein
MSRGAILRYISIRSSWALFFLAAMKCLRIPFPSNVDSLKAFKLNQDCIHRSDLRCVFIGRDGAGRTTGSQENG